MHGKQQHRKRDGERNIVSIKLLQKKEKFIK